MALNNPDCSLPMQYLLAICLSAREITSFERMIEKYSWTKVLLALSATHQEAVMALYPGAPSKWIKYRISSDTERRFKSFGEKMKWVKLQPDNPENKESMRKNFRDTYWYYLLFSDSGR